MQYGPERELIYKSDSFVENGKSVTYQTTYLGNYEKVYRTGDAGTLTEHKFYIGDVVYTQRSNGSNDTFYLHKDHQGSVIATTNASGAVVSQAIYDPWGKRTAVYLTSVLANFTYSEPTDRGYTGHKHIKDLDIIHMGGRIYDPTIGRFLQADPNIQAPLDSQSYNRYAYVRNNPMSMTDPSGYFFKSLFGFVKKYWKVILAVVATVVTYGAAASWLMSAGFTAFSSGSCIGLTLSTGGGMIAGAISGAVGGLISTGSLRGGLTGALSGGVFGGLGAYFNTNSVSAVNQTLAHGAAGGVMSVLQGENFGNGFLTAGVMKAVSFKNSVSTGGDIGEITGKSMIQAIAGGTLSKLTGGKFANGAITSAIQYTVNGISEKIIEWAQKQNIKWDAARKVKAIDEEMERLENLYLNDQNALINELRVFHGFSGEQSDLRFAYTTLQLDLTIHRTQALYTAVSGMRPVVMKPSISSTGVLKPDMGSAIGAWPLIAFIGTVTYSTSYSCGNRVCQVQEFFVYD